MTTNLTEEGLEALRRGARRRYMLALILSGILCLAYLALIIPYQLKHGEYGLVWDMAAAAVAVVILTVGSFLLLWTLIVKRAYGRFNRLFKNEYVLRTIEGMGRFEQLEYRPQEGFSHDSIRNAAVVACGDKKHFTSEDLLCGVYRGVRFWISDVTTRRRVQRRNRSSVEVIFEGQVIRFALSGRAKASQGHVQIFQKEFLSNFKGWTAEHAIQTENMAFNSRFQIYAADEHNAFYILTPPAHGKAHGLYRRGGRAGVGVLPGAGPVRGGQAPAQHVRRLCGPARVRAAGQHPPGRPAASAGRGHPPVQGRTGGIKARRSKPAGKDYYV